MFSAGFTSPKLVYKLILASCVPTRVVIFVDVLEIYESLPLRHWMWVLLAHFVTHDYFQYNQFFTS